MLKTIDYINSGKINCPFCKKDLVVEQFYNECGCDSRFSISKDLRIDFYFKNYLVDWSFSSKTFEIYTRKPFELILRSNNILIDLLADVEKQINAILAFC